MANDDAVILPPDDITYQGLRVVQSENYSVVPPISGGTKTATGVHGGACSSSSAPNVSHSVEITLKSTEAPLAIMNAEGTQDAPIIVDSNEPTGANNLTVSGTIDGKFDLGYIVTVNIGNQLLRGVLYHVHSPIQALESGPIVPYIPTTCSVKRRKKYNRAADHPKPNRSAYNFFFAETHSRLKSQYPHMEREHIKMIGETWSKLTEAEKEVYNDYGRRDKERYTRELQEYRQRLSLVQPRGVLKISDVARETGSVNSNEVEMGESSNTKDEA